MPGKPTLNDLMAHVGYLLLRWALVEGAVVPEESIHSIRVLERFSFVELGADYAERAVEYLDGTKLKGKQIRMEVARS